MEGNSDPTINLIFNRQNLNFQSSKKERDQPYCGMILKNGILSLVATTFFLVASAYAQSTFQPMDQDIYHWVTRAEIKTNALNGRFHSAVQAISRKEIVALMDSNQKWNSGKLSKIDRYHIQYFREVNSEWVHPDSSSMRKPIWNALFKRKADILSYRDNTFDVHANIVGNGALGKASDNTSSQYINSRGVEIRGMIAERVGFYAFMTENQMTTPGYVNQWTAQYNSVPHEGFWKKFRSNGYDFFTARGYITFRAAKYIDFQIGHDRLQIGNGYRSLILSDFGNNYSFAKINTKVWKLQYTNVFANIKGDITQGPTGTPGSKLIPDKYLFFHRLGINIGKKLNIGIFESIIAGRDPAIYPNGTRLDLAYLNPIIFYRSMEQNSGSPDNAGLGLDAKAIPIKNVMVYGQIFLDEFLLKEIQAQKGWWANKYAFQIGGKYIDMFGLKNVDLQLEYNFVRPYTYTHQSQYTSYAHYSQPLAHPLGANFSEFMGILRIQPIPRLTASFKAIYYQKGFDQNSINYGGNIFLSYNTRFQNYGNDMAQGRKINVLFLDATIAYQAWTNLFFEFKQVVRKVSGSLLPSEKSSTFTSLALRWNFPQRLHEF